MPGRHEIRGMGRRGGVESDYDSNIPCICITQWGYLHCPNCDDPLNDATQENYAERRSKLCSKCRDGFCDFSHYRIAHPKCLRHKGDEDPYRPRVLSPNLIEEYGKLGLSVDEIPR